METKTTREALDLAEAREQALIDRINGELPQEAIDKDYPLEIFIDREMYTRCMFNINGKPESFAVPCHRFNEIEDALRLDGVEDYTYTIYDEHFIYETIRVWFNGMTLHYREIAHGSAVAVHLAPAGTLMDED